MTATERTRLWRIAHPERAKEACKRWRNANLAQAKALNKVWRLRNAAKIKQRRIIDAPRRQETKKAWILANPFKVKMGYVRRMLRRAGCPEVEITKAEAAWTTFNGVCQACKTACSSNWVTDHDHKKCTFRGIIGDGCNLALGKATDSPIKLRALAEYLERQS